ncbi:syntaxin [Thraustotheca clavata]|uniref:Syntaxin n=1 Tax=Thraustotheca clavata TaxID=74557 RepID=A0A1W0ABR7_9STRA|nr:syntaxin [Thraustotheca clavata]
MAQRALTAKFLDRRAYIHRRQHYAMEKKREGYVDDMMRKLEDGKKKPVWTQSVEQANVYMNELQMKLDYLQKIHTRRLMVRFDGQEKQQEHEIDSLTQAISILFQETEAIVRSVTKEQSASSAERSVRVNVQRSLACKLQEMSSQYRRAQREYMNTLSSQRHMTNNIFKLPDTDKKQSQSQRLLQFDDDQDESMVEAREREIQKIAKSIVDLSAVFKEVANMVVTKMQCGLKELRRAEKYQYNARPARCIYTLLGLISLCFMILLMKHATPYIEY